MSPIGVPLPGNWVEVLNTDDRAFGGSGVANGATLATSDIPLDGHEYSLSLSLPPLAVLWLKPAETKGVRLAQSKYAGCAEGCPQSSAD